MHEEENRADLHTRIMENDKDETRAHDTSERTRVNEKPSTTSRAEVATKKRRPDTNISVGMLLDQRFVLEQFLGQGGMSVVYRAKDLVKERAGDPKPHVAIKILRADLSDTPDAVIALQRETKKAQMLAHPRIVTVHDFQIDRELGLAFVQMEELRGQSLRQLIDQSLTGLSDEKRAISIILSIADGLDYAHKRGIVHSDLKPSNVFVTEKGEVKILDFGIARAIPGSDTDTFDAGSLGALTPGYATSEMFDGESPDPSDDIYALGIIAHELLTGSHPFHQVLRDSEPAKAAKELGLKPDRIKGLNRRQWRTIADSLTFERPNRPADAGEFLRRFRQRSNLPLYLGSALLLLTGLLIWSYMRPSELTPEVPFEELAVETREAFNRNIEDGWTAFNFQDYNGALHYFSQAYELHRYNPLAMEGLDAIVEKVKSQDNGNSRAELESKLRTVQILLSHDALAERGDLRELEQSLKISLEEASRLD